MLLIIAAGFITIAAIFFILTWIEDHFQQNAEFVSIQEWEEFQQSMKKKGNK